MKITSFTQLEVWKESHKLVLTIYKITKFFPKEEMFALVAQMRRCAISITSNIAEGFSRQGKKEKLQFYYTSKGSITEIQNQLLVARDVGYITNKLFQETAQKTIHIHKMLNGLMKSAESRKL